MRADRAAGAQSPLWEKVLVAALIVFATSNALLWSLIREPGHGGPDEPGHFGVVDAIYREGGWPIFRGYPPEKFSRGAIRAQVAYELGPNFAALPAALLLRLFGAQDYSFNYHLARLINVALFPATLWLSYLTLRRVFRASPAMRVWPLALMATVPQFTLIHSYVTNDSPAVAASTFAIYASVRALQSGFRRRDVMLLGIALGAVALHKFTSFLIFPAVALLLLAALWRNPRRLLSTAAQLAVLVLAVSLWWYVRMLVLYGDPFGVATTQAAVNASGGAPIPFRDRGVSLPDFLRTTSWVGENFATFWAGYGLNKLKLPAATYLALAGLCVAATAGLLVRLGAWIARRSRSSSESLLVAWCALLFLGLLGLSLWSSYSVDFALHGRYLFPEFLPFVVILTAGLAAFAPPLRRAAFLPLATVPLLVAGNLAYTLATIVPDVVAIVRPA